jgi:hypothetical protein
MKTQVKLIVIIPVGTLSSKNQPRHIADTIESVIHYTTPDRRIVIVDNSSPLNFGISLQTMYPELEVIRPPVNYRMYGGLYKSLSLALLHVHASYDFELLIKMDTDALLIGAGLEDAALAVLQANSNAGVLGNYFNDGVETKWPRDRILAECSSVGWLKDRERCATLRYYLQQARAHGYQPGEHVLGGTAVFSPAFVDRLVQNGLLLREEIKRSKLQEDHLFGLFCKVTGLDLIRFAIPEHPLAVVWQGLPHSPEELVRLGAKVIHSTRYWEDMNEDEIRAFFKEHRTPGQSYGANDAGLLPARPALFV